MKGIEFVTWLQKEMGEDKPLTLRQAVEIEKNAKTVEWERSPPESMEERAACIAAFTEGALLGVEEYGCSDASLQKLTSHLRTKLAQLFADAGQARKPGLAEGACAEDEKRSTYDQKGRKEAGPRAG